MGKCHKTIKKKDEKTCKIDKKFWTRLENVLAGKEAVASCVKG